jgi:hypothetical protein
MRLTSVILLLKDPQERVSAAALYANIQKDWEALDLYRSIYDYPADWQRLRDELGLAEELTTLPAAYRPRPAGRVAHSGALGYDCSRLRLPTTPPSKPAATIVSASPP